MMDRKLIRLLLCSLSLLVATFAFNPSTAAAKPAFCAGQCVEPCPVNGQAICQMYCEEPEFVCKSAPCPGLEVWFDCESEAT